MPLPSALAARLSKRGIISSKKGENAKKNQYKGFSACPNKSNIYHECNYWCETHWKGVLTPDARYLRNIQKMLFKYPLPGNWTEIFDKGVGRYYYWNMENDLVSWLPPRHPKSIKIQSAAKLREKLINKEQEILSTQYDSENKSQSDSDDESNQHHTKYKEDKSKREERHHPRKKGKREGPLDPMDPSAYSDIPQGTWSDGLETNKDKADNTASGVLYQQRPYPAPGEVLASNKEKNKKK